MILLIDSYDSFSHNLRRLIEDHAQKQVVTIFNDTFAPHEYESVFDAWISGFDYIVVGPGPGHPREPADIGIVGWLFRHFGANPDRSVPVLGVCLGFQSLCHEFGNPVEMLDSIKHGQIYEITPVASDLFPASSEGKSDTGTKTGAAKPFPSVRYHSLHVDVESLNDEIVPLATCEEQEAPASATTDETLVESRPRSKKILMAGRHARLPLYGVQYHPESICSAEGDALIRNFDKIAREYNLKSRPDLEAVQNRSEMIETNQKMVDLRSFHESYLVSEAPFSCNGAPELYVKQFRPHTPESSPIDVCDYLAQKEIEFTFLNSAADPGQWSIIGLPVAGDSEVISHSVDTPQKVVALKYKLDESREVHDVESMWHFLASRMAATYVSREALEKKMGPVHTRPFPFFGGYMGILSYEEGKHLDFKAMEPPCEGSSPDTKLVFIERFILHDRITNSWFLVSIKPGDADFCTTLLHDISSTPDLKIDASLVPKSVKDLCRPEDQTITYEFPSRDIYEKQFNLCQDYLHSGDSYELCLTTQLKIFLPQYLNPWDIYKVLAVHKNPSPYSSYMNFDDCILILSSPERFLSWTDSEKADQKIAELRPIKGTVRNTESVSLEDATKILRTPKEMGENLMIVDLIRHDLQSFTEEVTVDALMEVEEYKTVYQLVSVIRGHLKKTGHKGIDILHLSLPPGSMTGAPKKRSIELLQHIESLQPTMMPGGRRGLYSGVAGYWSITDDADWSVTIRSIVSYKQDKERSDTLNVWRIGAGGAITVLSDEAGEWEEMHVKLSSTLQTFL